MVTTMKLWAAMQRIERYRYQAELVGARMQECSPEHREIMRIIERQWLELAAQTQALFEAIESPRLTPIPYMSARAANDREPLEQRGYL